MLHNWSPVRVLTVLGSLVFSANSAWAQGEHGIFEDPNDHVSIASFSAQASESLVVTFGLRPIPPEQAVANGVPAFDEVVILLRKDSGDLLADPADLPRIKIHRGALVSVRIRASNCPVDGDLCDITVEVPDGTPYVYPGARQRKFGRVVSTISVACETKPCGPRAFGTATVVGADGSTSAGWGLTFSESLAATDGF